MLRPSQFLDDMQPNSLKIPNNASQPAEINELQDEPGIRNARTKLDYKKSFQDDHFFFPETKIVAAENPYRYRNYMVPPEMPAYMSPGNNAIPLNGAVDGQTFYHNNDYHQAQKQQVQKENLLSLLALKNMEKHQQQESQKQLQQQFYPNHVGSQPVRLQRGGQFYYSDNQQQQRYREPYPVNQNTYNYVNLRARG